MAQRIDENCFMDYGPDIADVIDHGPPDIPFRDGDELPRRGEPNPEITFSTGTASARLILDRFRPKEYVFRDMQFTSKIPFYDWWRNLENARSQVEAMTRMSFGEVAQLARGFSYQERGMIQNLLETKHQSPDAYAKMVGKTDKVLVDAADQLEGILERYFKDHEVNINVSDFLATFPQIRKAKGLVPLFMGGKSIVPKPLSMLSRSMLDVVENLDEREMDFSVLARRVIRATANDKHLVRIWKEVDDDLKKYQIARGDATLLPYFTYFDSFRKGMQHATDDNAIAMGGAFKKVMEKLFGERIRDEDSLDLVSVLTSANYYANMSFQVGMVARNMLQTLQTTYPLVGGKDTLKGLKMAKQWYRDPKLREELERLGVVARDPYAEPMRDLARIALEGTKSDQWRKVEGHVFNFLEKGVSWYQSADNFNKVTAYYAMRSRAERAVNAFKRHGNFTQFVEESGLDLLDRVEGPSAMLIKRSLERQQYDGAIHLMGKIAAEHTQFIYSRGNEAQILSSSVGRLFGQYGTWPTWYASYLADMFGLTGTPLLQSRNKQIALARWVAVNSAMYVGMAEAFDVDFARWTFFAPLAYRGGPMAQLALQASHAVEEGVMPGEARDPVSRIEAARLPGNALRQLTPLPVGAVQTYFRAADELWDENYSDAMRRFWGLPEKE